jgi:hypothetical protein
VHDIGDAVVNRGSNSTPSVGAQWARKSPVGSDDGLLVIVAKTPVKPTYIGGLHVRHRNIPPAVLAFALLQRTRRR